MDNNSLHEKTRREIIWISVESPDGSVVKNPAGNAGDTREAGLFPGLERSPGGRIGNPLQYSCLENSMDRGAWRAAVHKVTKSQKWLSMHAQMHRQKVLKVDVWKNGEDLGEYWWGCRFGLMRSRWQWLEPDRRWILYYVKVPRWFWGCIP